MWKKIIFAMMLFCGIGMIAVAATPEDFHEGPFGKESGYPGDLPVGWVYKVGTSGGYQIRNPKNENFIAGIGVVKDENVSKLTVDQVAQSRMDAMKLTPEETAKVVRVRSQYGEMKFSGYRLNQNSSKSPYMSVDYFIYKERPYLVFSMSSHSQEELDRNRTTLLEAVFGAKIREVESKGK